mgnify:CR=1 FL=1
MAIQSPGVSGNSGLSALMNERAQRTGMRVVIPSLVLCTDNAAMIGLVGRQKLMHGLNDELTFTVGSTALRAAKK